LYILAVLADRGWSVEIILTTAQKARSTLLFLLERLPLINMLTVPLIAPYRGANAF
jgi:hypothetical protein